MTDQFFDYTQSVPEMLAQMAKVNTELSTYDLPTKLKHLVELRASQINKCAYCIKLHTSAARQDGETDARLDRVIVWRLVDDFTAAEKAAFAWTEALTTLDEQIDLQPIREALQEYFTLEQIGALTGLIAQINLWNRIQRSVH